MQLHLRCLSMPGAFFIAAWSPSAWARPAEGPLRLLAQADATAAGEPSAVVVAPRLLSQVSPAYPAEALATRASGEVTVIVTVAADGSVAAVTSEGGPELFVESALDAARKLRFEPGRRNSEPVESTTRVVFQFQPPAAPLPTSEVSEELVVEESRLGESVSTQDTHAKETLTEESMDRAQGKDLGETISEIPGVTTSRGSVDATKPIIRGQYERRLLILFDGVRHESQKWGIDHAPEIDPFAAGQISVVKGAAGVKYGPDAIGGVVLVDPPRMRTEPGFGGRTQLVGVSNGRRGISATRLEGASTRVPGLSWRLEGNYGRGAAMRTPTYVVGNTASEQWNASSSVQYQAGLHQLRISYYHFSLTSGVCYCANSGTPSDFLSQIDRDKPIGSENWEESYSIGKPKQSVQHDLLLGRGLFVLGNAGVLRTTYSFQLNRRREYEHVRESITGPQYDFTLHTHSLETAFLHAPIALGVSSTMEGEAGVVASRQDNVYSGLPLVPNHEALGAGVFALERVTSGEKAIEIGARYDHQSRQSYLTLSSFNRHIARGTLGEGDCDRGANAARCAKAFDAATLSLGGLWHPIPDALEMRLDLSSASRFPNGDELYISGTAPTFPVYALGDPSLGVETTWGASPTIGVRGSWLRAEGSGYFNYIENYVYFAPEIDDDGEPQFDVTIRGAFPRFGTHPIDARFYGFDGGMTIGPDSPVALDLTGSIVRAEDTRTGKSLVFIPADRARAALTYRRPAAGPFTEVFVQASGLFVAKQSQVETSADFAPAPNAYSLLGAAAGAQLSLPGRRTLLLGLEAENLLNTRYRDYTSLLRYYSDEPGREVRLRLGLEF